MQLNDFLAGQYPIPACRVCRLPEDIVRQIDEAAVAHRYQIDDMTLGTPSRFLRDVWDWLHGMFPPYSCDIGPDQIGAHIWCCVFTPETFAADEQPLSAVLESEVE